MKSKSRFILLFFALALTAPFGARAQNGQIIQDKQETVLAKVLEIVKQEEKEVPGTDTKSNFQTIKTEILEGDLKGKIIEIENDYLNLKAGEKFYVLHTIDGENGREYFSVQEKYRLPSLFILIAIFVLAVLVLGGIQGLRGLLSLMGSLLLIIFVLLPGIMKGFSPIVVTLAVSSVIIIIGSYVTHGFNKTTTAAVIGMILTVCITGLFAYFAVKLTGLSGFESEEAVYLNLNARGSIDIVGLLFGGIMIGLLGVLYDVAIGQAISVEELFKIAPHTSAKKIYERAIRIGREHIGALVNTLAIAYVGASLPLLLLFYQTSVGHYLTTLNREIFATEIVRTMIGSIGLVLAVPITTLVAIKMLRNRNIHQISRDDLEDEENHLEKVSGHSH